MTAMHHPTQTGITVSTAITAGGLTGSLIARPTKGG